MYMLTTLWEDYYLPKRQKAKEGSEYARLQERSLECRELIWKELSEEGRKVFEIYERATQSLDEISEEELFIEGVQIGAQLMLDVLGGDQNLDG